MEEQKLVRRKKKAQSSGNRRALAEACNDLAALYFKLGRYEEARDEYGEEAELWAELGQRLEWGASNRMVGEACMMLAEFDEALKYEEKHLAVARELSNQVEEQRAMATLGRIHLLRGQSLAGECSAAALKAAESAFMKSLVLCESLKGKIAMHEIMDMRARLLLNIGVVLEQLGCAERAVSFFHKAVSICSSQDLFDVLHQCHVTEAHLHNKGKDYTKALACLNKALEVASRLEEKALKQCETLSLKAEILCKMSDYQSAKQVLLKAWKLDTPDENEKRNIEKNLKIAAAVCYTRDVVAATAADEHATLRRLHERLGDGACALGDLAGAAAAYQHMLEHARAAGDTGAALVPVYVSLYQTYRDMGQYTEALRYYELEYELISGSPREAYTTLCNIAEVRHLAGQPYERVEQACAEARVAAAKLGQKYKVRLLKSLLKYQERYGETDKMDDTKAELKLLGHFQLDNLDSSEDESSSGPSQEEQDTTNIGDDICIEDLTDLETAEEEEEAAERARGEGRRRARGIAVKKNAKGETQLHLACISGNQLLVERLLSSGHPVNVRDHAGWLPLHEACIHGHADVARLLTERGAHLNDRGGDKCDGITPMYDAACNGHLDIVQLLLDKGAQPSVQTDFGETPLDALRKWRKQNILSAEEEVLYKKVCNQIINNLEKRPAQDVANKSNSKSPHKPISTVSPPSTSKCKIYDNDIPVFRSRNIIDDDSDDDINLSQMKGNDTDSGDSSDEIVKPKKKDAGVNEYKNAMLALRKRNASDELPEVDLKVKPKPALLAPEEVDDDWLEDDIGVNKNKKRKISDDNLTVITSKKQSLESVKESIANINKNSRDPAEKLNKSNSDRSSNNSRSRISDVIDSDHSSDSENFRMRENINPNSGKPTAFNDLLRGNILDFDSSKASSDSRQNMNKRWKRQSTLLKAGFRRKRNSSENFGLSGSSNSNSDCEISHKSAKDSPKVGLSVNKIHETALSSERLTARNLENFSNRGAHSNFMRKSSNERLSASSTAQVASVAHPVNVVQPINIMQSGQIVPPAAVRVKVEDKVLLISLNLKTINRLTISWLVEEVKNRYYKVTGVRPTFSLLTSDGAILSEEDPLSLVLTSPELHTSVTGWKASPAEERYLECCEALEIATSEEIQQAIGRSHTTHRLALGARTLTSAQTKPLFRALTHQSHLTALLLSDNNLRDEGVRCLIECLCTLKQLTVLDVSSNNITSEGTKVLLNMFEKSTRPVCQSLEQLILSSNPIGDVGFRHVMEMSNYVKLKALRINNCGVTENALDCVNRPQISLDRVEVLELSNNNVKQGLLEEIMTRLNAAILVELELENIGVPGAVVSGMLGKFFEHATDLKMRKLNLSKCGLTDGDFMKFYRYLSRAKNLQSVTLKHNSLTFITLKKLLRREPPVPCVQLVGCADLFKYALDSDFPVWLPALDYGARVPELEVAAPAAAADDAQRDGYRHFCRTWLGCFRGRGVVEHADGAVRFTAR